MLYFTFNKPDDYIRGVPMYFKHHLDMSILNNDFIKMMVKDVDNTELVSENRYV